METQLTFLLLYAPSEQIVNYFISLWLKDFRPDSKDSVKPKDFAPAQASLVVSNLQPAPRRFTARGSGFKPDTTRTNHARMGIMDSALTMTANLPSK
jgi:hypothetical protein